MRNLMDDLANDTIYLEKPDGQPRRGPAKAVVQPKKIVTTDASLPIDDGDTLVRVLPDGREERYTVLSSNYQQGFGPIEAHYQPDVRKESALPRQQPRPGSITTTHNYYLHGPNSRVNVDSEDYSTNVVESSRLFADLSQTLAQKVDEPELRDKLLRLASEMEQGQRKPTFAQKYAEFMALAANHMAVLTPFLPGLAQLILPS